MNNSNHQNNFSIYQDSTINSTIPEDDDVFFTPSASPDINTPIRHRTTVQNRVPLQEISGSRKHQPKIIQNRAISCEKASDRCLMYVGLALCAAFLLGFVVGRVMSSE